ncbi:hypothetical protein [Paractinoplanes durhamensis]|uniref:Uncharacterized protein n=1 Tax=Paractinoplanes durhamensis TaxID=113563 RepID=A0ABQ3YQD4_9ACTN|nr:hypothetical protein [Actinoplanes durhamensis]GID99790.1 hypothetical protein Adu01nite_11410 [Actinoplanes durhamensis]
MSDNQTAQRIKVTRHHSVIGSASVVVPVMTVQEAVREAVRATPPDLPPDEALQVLALAQRTAENHIAAANRHAQTVRAEAQTSAEQIRAEAHSYTEKAHAEADRLLDEARAAVEQLKRDAGARADEIRSQAASALDDARAEADRIVAEGRDRAQESDLRAQQRYEDAVGSLAIKREALQKQIETLVVFDADYRQRLTSFMHTQLRVLWGERPEAAGEQGVPVHLPGGPVGSADEV